eukprot:GHRQ01029486.1.p1 GENE.GHRQ01029486.1~~GHRQ01029486.1.p1  ORF type:complete len:159 (+),score=50.80 GHRQ01029486.1:680-1156(+)
MCSSCSPQWANLQNFQRPKPCRVLLYTSAAAAAAAAELHPCVYIAAPQGDERVDVPLHLQVSSASTAAQELLEAAGGSVTRVYYTRLGLTALLKPENLEKQGRALPRPVRAWPPRDNGKYDAIGQLPPATQLPQAALPVTAARGPADGRLARAVLSSS